MAQYKLPADANRILFVRHLPDSISHGELYELFGRYGAVEQIRLYVIEPWKRRIFQNRAFFPTFLALDDC